MRKILFILGELDDADVDWLMQVGRKEQIASGSRLIEEGQPVDAFYVVVSGEFQVVVEALQGREIARLKSGEVFGEISFLDSRPPVATVIATRDSIVFTIPEKALQQKLDDGGKFASHFYRAIALFLADRIRNTVGLLGYGQEYPPDSPMQLVRDISPQTVENLPIARRRLDVFVRRLRGY
ncbi:MAG: cyclic nucleotide-binding domain-containing protein [Alkalinema sp. CAN_BIN05]|nr:cyclic nucleotide-binding domain-containing protein [Alkalinema sp. CAN_BIN05]